MVGMIAALSAIATSLELNEVQTLERQTQSTFFIGVAQSLLPKISLFWQSMIFLSAKANFMIRKLTFF